jgi:hypothetical protein
MFRNHLASSNIIVLFPNSQVEDILKMGALSLSGETYHGTLMFYSADTLIIISIYLLKEIHIKSKSPHAVFH